MLEGGAQGLPVNIAALNTNQVASMLDTCPWGRVWTASWLFLRDGH
jgi:hypothetical protein